MDIEGLPPPVGIGPLLVAMNSQNWEEFDRLRLESPSNEGFFHWAEQAQSLLSPNPNFRDGAARIMESAGGDLPPDVLRTLHQVMTEQVDNPRFLSARYRAASALFAHGQPSEEAKAAIKEATVSGDKKLAEAARQRLLEIEETER